MPGPLELLAFKLVFYVVILMIPTVELLPIDRLNADTIITAVFIIKQI